MLKKTEITKATGYAPVANVNQLNNKLHMGSTELFLLQ